MTNFYIVSYDIVNTKRRNLVAKCLENYGTRVQYSVFECKLDLEMYKTMQQELEKMIDVTEDSVRFYALCNSCEKKITILGCGEITKDEDVYVV